MKIFLLILHIATAVSLITLILLQNSKGGLGGGLGSGEFYRSKRGAERIVFMSTIIFAALFLLTSVANLIVH
jgi:protein translocase SecG subunit